jgi:hypothetical protein
MTKAHFTIEVDLPEGTTEGLFRRWVLSCIKHAHNRIDPAAVLYDLKIDTLRMTTVSVPVVKHRPQNFVVAEEVQSKSRLHRQGETPVRVFRFHPAHIEERLKSKS